MLELLAVRTDLGVDERAHRVTNHLQLFGPLEHRSLPGQAPVHRRAGRRPHIAHAPRKRAGGVRGSVGRPEGRCMLRTEAMTHAGRSPGMDAGGICVARSLPIDAALVRDVLIRLRRDVPGGVARWRLGERGAAEIDVDFFPIMTASGDTSPAWSSTARLWDPDGIAMLPAVVEIRAEAVDTCELTLRPAAPPAPGGRPAPRRCSTSPAPRSTSSARNCCGTPHARTWPRTATSSSSSA